MEEYRLLIEANYAGNKFKTITVVRARNELDAIEVAVSLSLYEGVVPLAIGFMGDNLRKIITVLPETKVEYRVNGQY